MTDADIKRAYYERGYEDGEEKAFKDMYEMLKNPLTRKLIIDIATKEIKAEDLQAEINKHIKELYDIQNTKGH